MDSSSPTSHSVPSRILHMPILLGSLGFGMMAFMLPIYARELNSSALEIGGLFSVFSATAMVLRPFVGWGLDRFGRKSFFVAALAAYSLTLALLAFAQSLPGLYAARIVQGFASSIMWVTAYTIAADLAPRDSRARSVAVVDAASNQGALYGSFPGFFFFSILPLRTAWMVVFGIYAVAALAGAWLAQRKLTETRLEHSPKQPGEPANNLITPGLIKLMVIILITNTAASLVAPILLIFLQDQFTTDIKNIAIAYIPAAMAYSFLPTRLGPLSDRIGRTPVIVLGLVISAVVSLAIPSSSLFSYGLILLAALWVVEAVGFVLASPAQEALVADLTHHEQRGQGYGFYYFASGLGVVIGPLAGGWLYDTYSHAAPFYFNAAILFFCAILVPVLLKKIKTG